MVGGGEHKVVVDEGGFRVYCVGVDWSLNFLSVPALKNIFELLEVQA